MEQTTPERSKFRADVVSNVNALRTGQILDELRRLDKRQQILLPGKQIILVERNPQYLEEILGKLIPELCPQNDLQVTRHQLPHYTVRDGEVKAHYNLDPESDLILVQGRIKHPDSIGEKIPRKAHIYGRTCEAHDRNRLMIGDIIGIEAVVREPHQVYELTNKITRLPYLRTEKLEHHKKSNGYTATHLNMRYSNGNPSMRELELEIQITDQASHTRSKTDKAQAHDTAYGVEKLSSKHSLDGQLIIVGGMTDTVTVPESCRQRLVDGNLIAWVDNSIQPYLLVLPECRN